MPHTPLKALFTPLDTHLLTNIGFFHRGWAMFGGGGAGAGIYRVRFDWNDNTVTYRYAFPRLSSPWPSVWSEVLEDIIVRDDNNDSHRFARDGYLRHLCHEEQETLVAISFESSWVSLADSFAYINTPEELLSYNTFLRFPCPET